MSCHSVFCEKGGRPKLHFSSKRKGQVIITPFRRRHPLGVRNEYQIHQCFLPLNVRKGWKFELQNKNNITGLQDLERRGGAGLVHLLERQGQDDNLRRRLFSHKREQEQQHFQGRR